MFSGPLQKDLSKGKWSLACAAGGIVYCVIKVLAAEPRSKKKEWGRGVISRGSAANSHSTGTAAPPPNLPRLVHNTASYAG